MTDTDKSNRDWAVERIGLEDVEKIESLLTPKLTYTEYGNCAGCLTNGEVIDEAPELDGDGEHHPSHCSNCVDTAFEIDERYAGRVTGYSDTWEIGAELADEEAGFIPGIPAALAMAVRNIEGQTGDRK